MMGCLQFLIYQKVSDGLLPIAHKKWPDFISYFQKKVTWARYSKKPVDVKSQFGNATAKPLFTIEYRHKITGPEAITTRVQTISCPQKSTNINLGKNLAILALGFDALVHTWTQFVTSWVQRNLSPTASLQLHVSHLRTLIKEKTPHQEPGEALNLTFCEPELGVGGRTTP